MGKLFCLLLNLLLVLALHVVAAGSLGRVDGLLLCPDVGSTLVSVGLLLQLGDEGAFLLLLLVLILLLRFISLGVLVLGQAVEVFILCLLNLGDLA